MIRFTIAGRAEVLGSKLQHLRLRANGSSKRCSMQFGSPFLCSADKHGRNAAAIQGDIVRMQTGFGCIVRPGCRNLRIARAKKNLKVASSQCEEIPTIVRP